MLHVAGFTTEDLTRTDQDGREREINARFRDSVGTICDMISTRNAGLDGRFDLTVTPEMIVAFLSGLAIDCHRGVRHIANDGDDALVVHINLGTTSIYGGHLGRDYTVAAGEAAFGVHNAAIDFTTGEGTGLLGITVPRHLTESWRIPPEDLAGRTVPVSHPALQLLVPYARLFQSIRAQDLGLIAASTRHMALLLGAGFGAIDMNEESERHAPAVGEARLHAIRRLMRRDCTTEGLTAEGIGRRLGISERMVQHVLQQAGTSFSRQLGDFRAERARVLLTDPAFAATPTTEIGFRCGFNDVSSFYRAFKRRFDASPGDVRSRAG
ncbi:hypothetical protein ABAC460_05740 [Asticcacaulis sp. AC460]|uniref:helix-turn-helix transcriptional regulator n=1 Tax=Asticcacaulis sp. AC460 TaxID=1282360 RepID=UPI0003C40484|nr:helix-turn-helix transcriptional regulator [Asticcacaulis sp. AC460]ESQ91485.1 hypothetical protein ABAC460_05740 [Asticcacaulis sp. AC460]